MKETQERGSRTAGTWAKVSLALVSCLVTLVAVELGLRVDAQLENRGVLARLQADTDVAVEGAASLGHLIRPSTAPRVLYELRPGIRANYQGAWVEVNRHGFRGPVVEERREPGGCRIVGLGDSFMFGQGVGDSELYLAVLQGLLATASRALPVEVVNTAVPGYNTVMEVATLEARGLAYEPDLVIIEFVGNDVSLPNFVRDELPVLSLRRSFLVDFVRGRLGARPDESSGPPAPQGLRGILNDAAGALGLETDPARVPQEYRHMVGWGAYREAMERLRELSRHNGFEVVSIALAPDGGGWKLRALDISEELGFQVLDIGAVLAEYLRQQGGGPYLGSALAQSEVDGHPTALAHRLAAEALYGFLMERRLLHRCSAAHLTEGWPTVIAPGSSPTDAVRPRGAARTEGESDEEALRPSQAER